MLVSKLTIIKIINPLLEMKLDNRITIYKNKKDINNIKEVTENYLQIQEDRGDIINLFKEEWLIVLVIINQKLLNIKLKNKVYPLSSNAYALIDKKFNKMYLQGKILQTIELSLFTFPIFMIQKIVYKGIEKTPY